MATRKIKDAQDTTTNELIYFKGHAKATYMSDGRNVEEAIRQIGTGGGGGGIAIETDPIFSASPAASITEAKKSEWDEKYTKPSGGIPASDLASDVFLQGEKGEKGDKGDKGDTGAAGTNGKDGADGATFTPSVDATGNLSWTNNKGLTNPPTVNIKGPKGDSGEGGGGDSLWQEDTEGRAFCDRDIHVDGDISSSGTFIIGSMGVPLSEGYSTGDKGEILRANGDGSIGWDDLSIPTKVSQLENDNVYFTDFKVTDLELLVSGHLESLQIDGQGLMDAIYNGKTIFVPYGEAVIGGDAILLGEVVNTDIYFSVYTHQALVYYCEVIEVINDVIYGSGVIVGDLIAETVKQTQINNITHAAIANAMMTTGGYVFALPSDATGDEDDILLSRDSVKTINGQSIVRDEEGDDIHTTYPRVLATSASVALQPNAATVWNAPISAELALSFAEQQDQGYAAEYIARFSVGADGVQLIVPDGVVWADGILPAMTNGKTYEISFVDNLATFLEF